MKEEHLIEEVIEPNMLLTNKRGGYFLDSKETKYRGLFCAETSKDGWTLTKSVDTIGISHVPTGVVNKLWCFEKKYNNTTERFVHHKDSLLYEVENYDGSSLLTLDVRDVNDFGTDSKKYSISKEKDFIIIKYTKKGFDKIYCYKIKCTL